MEEFHKSLKSNANLAKSPTKNVRTQSNHVFMQFMQHLSLNVSALQKSAAHLLYAESYLLKHHFLHMNNFEFCRLLRNISYKVGIFRSAHKYKAEKN